MDMKMENDMRFQPQQQGVSWNLAVCNQSLTISYTQADDISVERLCQVVGYDTDTADQLGMFILAPW